MFVTRTLSVERLLCFSFDFDDSRNAMAWFRGFLLAWVIVWPSSLSLSLLAPLPPLPPSFRRYHPLREITRMADRRDYCRLPLFQPWNFWNDPETPRRAGDERASKWTYESTVDFLGKSFFTHRERNSLFLCLYFSTFLVLQYLHLDLTLSLSNKKRFTIL